MNTPDAVEITKDEFDAHCRAGRITDAVCEAFGDGHGEPYSPHRKLFGTLAGKRVWAWRNQQPAPLAEVGT